LFKFEPFAPKPRLAVVFVWYFSGVCCSHQRSAVYDTMANFDQTKLISALQATTLDGEHSDELGALF
jgi:hypothetical protein